MNLCCSLFFYLATHGNIAIIAQVSRPATILKKRTGAWKTGHDSADGIKGQLSALLKIQHKEIFKFRIETIQGKFEF